MITLEQLIAALELKPHPREGGHFAETYRSTLTLPSETMGGLFPGPRPAGTAIYYLLTPAGFSEMHRLPGDEIFHFYLGDPVEMLLLYPDGSGHTATLGTDILAGMRPQIVVPSGVWQGARLAPGGRFALLGATMAPGFDYADYEAGARDELLYLHPTFEEMIRALTRR